MLAPFSSICLCVWCDVKDALPKRIVKQRFEEHCMLPLPVVGSACSHGQWHIDSSEVPPRAEKVVGRFAMHITGVC